MKVLGVGYNWHYSSPENVQHAAGETDCLVYVFYTPADISLKNDIYQVDYGNILLLKKGTAHRITSATGFFILDWLEFSMQDIDQVFFQSLQISDGEILNVRNPDVLSKMMHNCCYIDAIGREEHQQTLVQLLMGVLFCISSLTESQNDLDFRSKYPEISALRRSIYENPQRNWNMKLMCRMTHSSVSKLQKQYKRMYSISCMEDVTVSRIHHSKNLLLMTSLSMYEIADQSGFHSYEHFARTFKKQVGCSPKAYQKMKLSDK